MRISGSKKNLEKYFLGRKYSDPLRCQPEGSHPLTQALVRFSFSILSSKRLLDLKKVSYSNPFSFSYLLFLQCMCTVQLFCLFLISVHSWVILQPFKYKTLQLQSNKRLLKRYKQLMYTKCLLTLQGIMFSEKSQSLNFTYRIVPFV